MDDLILAIVCGPGPAVGAESCSSQLCHAWVFPCVQPSQGEAGKPLGSARNGCELSLAVPSITQHNVTPQPAKLGEKQFSVSSNLPIRPLRAGLEMTRFSMKTSLRKCNRAFFLAKNSAKSISLLFLPPSTPWVKSTTGFWLLESQGRVLKYCPSPREVSQHSSEQALAEMKI